MAFAYTDKICEIKMRDCGLSLEDFIHTTLYQEMNGISRVCLVFDMMRQIIHPLQRLHKNGYVHADIKPENICVQMRPGYDYNSRFEPRLGQPYQTIFEFRLIDFGIMSKFKERKLMKIKPIFTGTLLFASARALRHENPRYQDDIESLLNVGIYMLFEALPWEDHRVRMQAGLNRLKGAEYKAAFKHMRLSGKEEFERTMINHFQNGMRRCPGYEEELFALGRTEEEVNPIYRLLRELHVINTNQLNMVKKHNLHPRQEKLTRSKADKLIEKAQEEGLSKVFELDWYEKVEEILNFPDGVFCI